MGWKISDRGFQIWGFLRSHSPNGLHSQEAFLCHTEAPTTSRNFGSVIAIGAKLNWLPTSSRKDTNLMCLSCKFKVWSFNNGINRACLLTESTVYALCHVNVIPENLHNDSMWGRGREETKKEEWKIPHLVVLRLPSSRSSASIVIACAGHT